MPESSSPLAGWGLPDSASVAGADGRCLTRDHLESFADQLRAVCLTLDMGSDDRIVTCFPQGELQFIANLAASTAALASPLPIDVTADELRAHLRLTAPAAALVCRALPAPLHTCLADAGIPILTLENDLSLQAENRTASAKSQRPTVNAGTGLLLPTSGTAGDAKLVRLSCVQLRTVALRIADSLALNSKDTLLSILPGHHIHAFSTALAAILSGGKVAFRSSFEARDAWDSLRTGDATWLSATPTHYRALLAAGDDLSEWSPPGALRFLRTASAPMDADLAAALEDRFGVPLIQAYGMTEAGPLIATNTVCAGDNRHGSVGKPVGVELRIGGPEQEAQADDGHGEIWIRGETVRTDYWSLERSSASPEAGQRWLNTGDLGYVDADGFLHLSGRARDVINSGGEKLLPLAIESVLREHSAVHDVVVFGAPHATLGEAPQAAVVLASDSVDSSREESQRSQLLEDVRQHCVRRLRRAQVPHRLHAVEEIPATGGGKIRRAELHAHFSVPGQNLARTRASAVPATNALAVQRVMDCWRQVLPDGVVDAVDGFFAQGGDSLSANYLILELENRFEVRLEQDFPFRYATVLQQADAIDAIVAGAPSAAGSGDDGATQVQRSRMGEIAPLSPGQKRLWLLDQLGAGATYNMCSPVWLVGDLNVARLERALDAVGRRHTALRSSIRLLDGQPVQYVERLPGTALTLMELETEPGDERREKEAEAVQRFAQAELAKSFDLSAAPPVRYHLLKLARNRHAFVLTIHHAFCDGWSVPVFYGDLLVSYGQQAEGDEGAKSTIKAVDYSYVDFSYEAEARLKSDAYASKLRWWVDQLAPIVRAPRLFSLSGMSTPAAHQGVRRRFDIDAEHLAALRARAQQLGTSLYPLFMAALQVALFSLTGRTRFCIGTVTANRPPQRYEDCVGFFANTLAISGELNADSRLSGHLQTVIEHCREAMLRSEVDLADVAGQLSGERRQDASTLVEVMLAFQNYPTLASRTAALPCDLEVEEIPMSSSVSRFPLSLYLFPEGSSLRGTWQYRSALLNDAQLGHVEAVFTGTLQAIARGDDPQLAALSPPAPTPEATRLSSTAGSRPQSMADSDETVVDLIDRLHEHARTQGSRIALSAAESELSYAQLLVEVTRLSTVIEDAGQSSGRRVGVLLPRGTESIIAPLAIWACGATYVPLDEALPIVRTASMCEAAGVELLLCNRAARSLAEALRGGGLEVELLDVADAADHQRALPQGRPLADTAAYVIFTSGSTGEPKGVELSYGNIRHYFPALAAALAVSPEDIYLHTAALAFSSSLRQFAVPLYAGARVHIADGGAVPNPELLPQLAEEQRVSILDLVPSHWRNLLRANQLTRDGRARIVSPRLLLSASEALGRDTARELTAVYPAAELVNMYGQTETTGIALLNNMVDVSVSGDSKLNVPLGRPLAGCTAVVLDAQQREVAPGEQGELVVLGPTVALGYCRDERASEERFIGIGGVPAYRSGDIVRCCSDGSYEFVGRADAQLKHRGYRIEPHELETAARLHPVVEDAVACLATGVGATAQLTLYFTANPESDVNGDLIESIRSHMRKRLPAYMVPQLLERLDALPRTLSGKVDRSALSTAVTPKVDRSGTEYTAVEDRLMLIWRDVLGIETLGLDDNFFDLGGDSLSSIDVIASAQNQGIALSLGQLFQHQTIRALAHETRENPATEQPVIARDTQPDWTSRDSASNGAGSPRRYDIESLRRFSIEALTKAGLAEEGASILTDVQLESSLRGQATHNIGDIPRYAKRFSKGVLNGRPEFVVEQVTPVSATIDGDNAPGQWVATVAMDKAIALAEAHGIGVVGVRRSNHYGAAGHYAWQATGAGQIGLCFTNGPVILAPTGGREPLFGNNPLAVGIPRQHRFPIVLDIAMSVATRGKIGLTVAEGKELEAGWILDQLGRPSTSLEDLGAGLAAPIGGHKGYGLAFVIEVLAGALTGSGYCADHRGKAAARHGGSDIGHLFITLKPDMLMPEELFRERVEDIARQTKTSRRADGVEEIFVPGEIEMLERERNMQAGIPLHDSAFRRLRDYARRFDIRSVIVEAEPQSEE